MCSATPEHERKKLIKTNTYKQKRGKRHVVTHPVIRANPVNGRKALYVGAHAQEIVGMPPAEGARLLDELTAFCTQPQFVYSHHWRDGDAVMWDNCGRRREDAGILPV
jgi:alpha-ketoglutarate-dependent taurine dioxygenase